MPAISKVRLTNVQFEQGNKRYNDELFVFDGQNSALLLENGGGKTVLIQTVLQVVIPNASIAGRKIRDTLDVTASPAHIAVEWILNDHPRHYALTAVTFYMGKEGPQYFMYASDYPEDAGERIETLPLARRSGNKSRPASQDEIKEYYQKEESDSMNSRFFTTKHLYQSYIEEQFQIVPSEWEAILKINSTEGGVENFFDNCKTTVQLADNLLIPVVEQGMEGRGTKDFARTFDNLRQQFREYLDLSEQIKEFRALSGEIGRVIDQYFLLDEKERDYRRQQARAKGLWQTVENELAETVTRQQELQAKEAKLQKENLQRRQKVASLEIARLQKRLEQKRAAAEELETEKEQAQSTYNTHDSHLRSLEYARLQKKLQNKEESLQYITEELKKLDLSPDVAQLKGELNRCLAGIRFHYDRTQEQLEQQKEAETTVQTAGRNKLRETDKQRQDKENELHRLELKIREIETELKNNRHRMKEIDLEILDSPGQENVPEKMEEWHRRSYDIENELHQNYQQQIANQNVIKDAQGALKKAHHSLNESTRQKSRAETRLAEIDARSNKLLQRLNRLSFREGEFNSLYRRQAGISHRLEEETQQHRSRREKLLEEARIQLRFYDLYKDNRAFTADPGLEKWVSRHETEFPGLQTGTDFLELYRREYSGTDMEELYHLFPFWPISVITGGRAEAARARLEKQAEKWTHPVFVLSRQEARAVIENREPYPARLVTPAHWPQITETENFREWMQEQQQLAESTNTARQEAEDLLQRWQSLAGEIRQFWQDYDYTEVYRPLKEDLDKAAADQQRAGEEIARLTGLIRQTEQQQTELQKRKKALEDEQEDISRRLRQGESWKVISNRQEVLLSRLDQKKAGQVPLKKEIARMQKTAELLEAEIKQQQEKVGEIDKALAALQAEDSYKKVRSIEPQPASESPETLQSMAVSLENKLMGMQENRAQLQKQQDELHAEVQSIREEINRHLEQYGKIIDHNIQFPPRGEMEMQRLYKMLQAAKEKLEEISERLNQARKEEAAEEARVNLQQKNYIAEFGSDTPVFDFAGQDLNRAQTELKQEKERLNRERELLARELQAVDKLKQELTPVLEELKVAGRVHNLQQENIESRPLSTGDEQIYPYRRLEFTLSLLDELQTAREKAGQQQKKVNRAREIFEEYCQRDLRDEKTKQQSLNGIRIKNTYREIKEWGEHLQERIQAAVNIAETEMRTRDEEVQNFINHLHSHLVRICEELQTIPRMTAVKVEERRKEIYDFTVPAWDENEGKAKLRQHLEWMLEKLEDNRFHTDQDLEDSAKIRKKIEGWLHPKQLLQVIDPGQEIKVRCRKVNNENHVSSTFTDWPRTENWSGGEKWSKNMTLFLGILNYLAEKRHHLRKHEGNHRVVLLDNPFGKASSDHVLAPVFFIAQQLGFQLLALTAHAEGKFLKDHFPVIYSLRLRRTADPSISVMTKEKQIRGAFFQDLSPTVLERLGQEEQLTPF